MRYQSARMQVDTVVDTQWMSFGMHSQWVARVVDVVLDLPHAHSKCSSMHKYPRGR